MLFKAILSTTILPLDGTYVVKSISPDIDLTGCIHYCGHPATKAILESMGATEALTKLFNGLEVGETALCASIKQGMSSRGIIGKTVDQDVTVDQLSFRIITRVSDYSGCGNDYCGARVD